MSDPAARRALDLSALTEPLTRAQVRAWRAELRAAGVPWARSASPELAALGFAVPAVVLVLVITATSVLGSSGGSRAETTGGTVVLLFFVALLAVFLIGIGRQLGLVGGSWGRWMRLDRLARANGLLFTPSTPSPSYPGAIFEQGHSGEAIEHLRTTEGRFLDFGNYSYVTGSGKRRRTHRWGFLALRLDRRLPHIVLDARANDGLFGGTNLPAVFDRDQMLSLEGDFDRHFRLYCPRDYERDALYVLTPDLMALLIDEAAPFDVEIVDDWLFVYRSGGYDSTDPAMITRLLRIVDTVGAKTLRQTGRYEDERATAASAAVSGADVDASRPDSAGIVAPQGRRLSRGVPVAAVVTLIVIVGFWAWSILPRLLP